MTLTSTVRMPASLRRAYLYIPCSSQRMLDKSLTLKADVLCYDLEDSVRPVDKDNARERLRVFLNSANFSQSTSIAVRINDTTTAHFNHDIDIAMSTPFVDTLILPKVHSAQDLNLVANALRYKSRPNAPPIRLVSSIESAKALWNLGSIASWSSSHGILGGQLDALLFAAEDYCADTSIIRTRSRHELLYTRSQLVVAAKAFGLHAIDMVCVNYEDANYLNEECEDGRRLGFGGKQAIHPKQIATIQSIFVPTQEEVRRAATIVHCMQTSSDGAFGLSTATGKEMIDAPMLKQAEKTLLMASAAGIKIPQIKSA